MENSAKYSMKIACDLDNTLCDTTKVLTTLMNFKHGSKMTREDITSWEYWLQPERADDFWAMYDMMDSIHLRRAMPPESPLAPGVVKALVKAGHSVDIVTANTDIAYNEIAGWLFGHGLYPDVRLKLIGRVSPSEKVKMDYDLFIDDSPKMIEPMRELPQGSGKTLILLTQPWNATIWINPSVYNIIRAKDWRDIQDILESKGLI